MFKLYKNDQRHKSSSSLRRTNKTKKKKSTLKWCFLSGAKTKHFKSSTFAIVKKINDQNKSKLNERKKTQHCLKMWPILTNN